VDGGAYKQVRTTGAVSFLGVCVDWLFIGVAGWMDCIVSQ
jgi:hypothetical protein